MWQVSGQLSGQSTVCDLESDMIFFTLFFSPRSLKVTTDGLW